MADWGPCDLIGSPLEIPGDGWPGPNTGTAVSWAPDCWSGDLVPVYWLVTYAYASGVIPLEAHPIQNSTFVDCSSPPIEDTISGYGSMGFGFSGQNPCPGEENGDGPSEGEGPDPNFPEDDSASATYDVKVLDYDSGVPIGGIRILATAMIDELDYYYQPQPPQCEGEPNWVTDIEKECITPLTDEFTGEAQCQLPLDPCTCSEQSCWREILDPSVPWGPPAASSPNGEWYMVDWVNGDGESTIDQTVYVRRAYSGQEVYACSDSATFYVDPSLDNTISFDLFAGSDEPSLELLIQVRDPTSAPFQPREISPRTMTRRSTFRGVTCGCRIRATSKICMSSSTATLPAGGSNWISFFQRIRSPRVSTARCPRRGGSWAGWSGS